MSLLRNETQAAVSLMAVEDNRSEQDQPRRASRRLSRLARFGLVVLALSVMGSYSSCDPIGPPTISCGPVDLRVEAGTCVAFVNPCHRAGLEVDGMRLHPSEDQLALVAGAQIQLHTTRNNDDVLTPSLCVGAVAPLTKPTDVTFMYAKGINYGLGDIHLTIAPRLTVVVTASSENVAVGQTTQLLAVPSGGIPPYFYTWTPTSSLDDSDIAAPRATPHFTTTYTVGVMDSGGQFVSETINIFVRSQLSAAATPPEIIPGDTVQLDALPEGGTPPYTFSWTPVETLDHSDVQSPLGTPTVTTTYHVTATDSEGAVTHASVEVFLATERLRVTASATPGSIHLGETSQLEAIAGGGVPPYQYSWTPVSSLSDPTIRNPIASPLSTQSYAITVTDSKGLSIRQFTSVQVVNPGPPVASFVFNVACCPQINLDASASTGNIVSYTWDLSWTPANPDLVSGSPLTAFGIREIDRGTITLTVANAAGVTATTTRNFPF